MVVKANLKHIRSLHRSKGRATHNQYIIEGRRLFQEALLTNEHLLALKCYREKASCSLTYHQAPDYQE